MVHRLIRNVECSACVCVCRLLQTLNCQNRGETEALTGEKKAEKWLKGSWCLAWRSSRVRRFSLSVQDSSTPLHTPGHIGPAFPLEPQCKVRGQKKKKSEKIILINL